MHKVEECLCPLRGWGSEKSFRIGLLDDSPGEHGILITAIVFSHMHLHSYYRCRLTKKQKIRLYYMYCRTRKNTRTQKNCWKMYILVHFSTPFPRMGVLPTPVWVLQPVGANWFLFVRPAPKPRWKPSRQNVIWFSTTPLYGSGSFMITSNANMRSVRRQIGRASCRERV